MTEPATAAPRLRFALLVVVALAVGLAATVALASNGPTRASADSSIWVNALAYGSVGGGFYWDSSTNQVWTSERGWHNFAPQPPRPAGALWVNYLDYGSAG